MVDLNYKRLVFHQLVHHCLHIISFSGCYQSTEHVDFRATIRMEINILAFGTGSSANHFHHIAGLSDICQLRPIGTFVSPWLSAISLTSILRAVEVSQPTTSSPI